MSDEMRVFGYLCPKCGKTVMAARSVFALEASNAEIECGCGGSSLRVDFDGESYRLYVPCGLCGETHMAVCPPERVLRGAAALGCAGTKQFCCFIGPEGTVEKNLRELESLAERYEETTGKPLSHFYRPPQGKYSEENLRQAQALGYHTVFWSLAYVDWNTDDQPTAQQAYDKLLPRIHDGAIVLLHSTSRTNAEILDDLLTKWEAMGYTFASLEELPGV